MNLQEKLSMQEQELYINEINMEDVDDMVQDNKVVALRNAEVIPMDIVPSFAISLVEARERIGMLQTFVKEMMVEGVDFGTIPGCQKPSLLKPGAEKLAEIFGFSKQVEVINRREDWDKGVFAYEVKVTLINKRTGLIEAEGIGSCNSMEKKYKQQDAFSIANTILKMSKKRALVDAVLSATRSSGLFTQDVEDIEFSKVEPPAVASYPKVPEQATRHEKPATQKQLNKMYYLAKEMKLPGTTARQMLKDRYGASSSDELTCQQALDFISHLINLQG